MSWLVLLPVRADAAEAGVLVLGKISDDPKGDYEQLKPLLDYIVPRLADVGVREGRIVMAKDVPQMASYLRRGRVDWVSESAGNAMLLARRAGARPALMGERGGAGRQHSVFFARRDSGIASLEDLRGRRVAFEHPSSTGGYLLPAAGLLDQGLQLEILQSAADPIGPEATGYLFARSPLNTATWVHQRLVDVGVLSHLDWDNPQQLPSRFRRDFVIIGRTTDHPAAVELLRGDLDPRIAKRLADVLLAAAADPDAAEALLRFFNTTGFAPLDAGSQRSLDEVARSVARVREALE